MTAHLRQHKTGSQNEAPFSERKIFYSHSTVTQKSATQEEALINETVDS
jgi:hypothetical protein